MRNYYEYYYICARLDPTRCCQEQNQLKAASVSAFERVAFGHNNGKQAKNMRNRSNRNRQPSCHSKSNK